MGRRLRAVLVTAALVLAAASAAEIGAPPAARAALPAGFTEAVAFSGLTNPTAVRFAPDGRVFVAEKRGTVQMFDSLNDPTPTQVADLRTEVYNFWDRGLSGLAIDPGFPARPYLYVLYTYDGALGETAPRWGTAGTDSDGCPNPPGATADGCAASGTLARLTLTGTTTTKQDLIRDWCQHYPGHTVDDLVFGPDGALYASAGDAANFNYADYGQTRNACGDPAGEGGALRAQDLRTPGDPVTLDGTVIRIDPDTGAAPPDNPNAAATDANARRIVAYGLRNPFRLALRPGTGDLWIANVGWDTADEVERHPDPATAVRDFGWPCYEGPGRHPAWDAADLPICENLYAAGPSAVVAPYFSYRHGQAVNAADTCRFSAGTAVSGLAFGRSPSPYPDGYDGALFVADYARQCIWVMSPGAGGLPDPATVRPFLAPAAGPVDLQLSPDGELYYADFDGGTIRRIRYGAGTTGCQVGEYEAEYFANRTLTGEPASRICEPGPLDHDWGGSGPAGVGPDDFSARWTGTFDFPTAGDWTFTAEADDGIRVSVDGTPLLDEWRDQSVTRFTATRALTAGTHVVEVEYYDSAVFAVARLDWAPADAQASPQPQITTPSATTTWRVGDPLSFSGSATDPEDGVLPASALHWEMVLQHCSTDCHAHQLQTWDGVAAGSLPAPDHEYPAYLELRLTATDSAGASTTVVRRLDPRTVPITVTTSPPGLTATLGSRTATTPFTSTVIVGSTSLLSAPTPQTLAGATYRFARWSDGGAASHPLVAGAAATTRTATYTLSACPVGQYRAQYFANRTLTGAAATTRCEPAPLAQNWGSGGPPGTGVNNFSARWTGTFTFPGGRRTFTATSDNGIRVWLDGVRIVDRWGRAGTSRVTRTVAAGQHTVRVDYWEGTGPASARLTW